MAGRRMLVSTVKVRMRTRGVQSVSGSPRELRGRPFRRAIPQYPVDAAHGRRCRVAAHACEQYSASSEIFRSRSFCFCRFFSFRVDDGYLKIEPDA